MLDCQPQHSFLSRYGLDATVQVITRTWTTPAWRLLGKRDVLMVPVTAQVQEPCFQGPEEAEVRKSQKPPTETGAQLLSAAFPETWVPCCPKRLAFLAGLQHGVERDRAGRMWDTEP